jgi:hypothetical protein
VAHHHLNSHDIITNSNDIPSVTTISPLILEHATTTLCTSRINGDVTNGVNNHNNKNHTTTNEAVGRRNEAKMLNNSNCETQIMPLLRSSSRNESFFFD